MGTITWQQQQEQHYLDRLRERWNEDGTRKSILLFADGISVTLPKPQEGQEGWIINDVQYVPLTDLCNQ